MVITKKSEEQIKDDIFNLFSQCRSETSPNRKPVLSSQLSENIFIWCRDFVFKNEAENMGEEIFKFSMRITKEDSKANIPMEKDGFLKYIYTSLKREKAGYYRKYKSREAEDAIRMKECFLGRKLTEDESSQLISIWFKNLEHIEMINENDPLNEYLLKYDTEIIQNAINSVLDKTQERSRDCYKALFTLFCFENDLKMLYPILDIEILKACQEDLKKPKQYEIYQKYHPEAKQDSAGVRASMMLNDFRNKIKIYLND